MRPAPHAVVITAALTAALSLARPARADGRESAPPAAPAPAAAAPAARQPAAPDPWADEYGKEMFFFDLAGLGLGVVSAYEAGQGNNSVAIKTGIAGGAVLLSNGIVFHALHHGSAGKLALTFFGRAGAVLVGGLAGGVVYLLVGLPLCLDAPYPANDMPGICNVQPVVPLIIGALVGGAVAVLLDDLLLAHDNTMRAEPSISVVPLVMPKGSPSMPAGGTGLALAARF